ncbi:MAG TPA: hypothetical protein VF365_03240 [Candidatus Limnocylindria bacterium]
MTARPSRPFPTAALVSALLGVQLVTLALASPARGVSALWSLTASPLTATTGVQRVFTLTATNEDPLAATLSSSEIGCIVVDVPGNFTVSAAVVTGSNSGDGWHVDSIAGNRVTVHTDSGGDRLPFLGWVRFTITATPFNTGSLAWSARAFAQQDCTGAAALVGTRPVVVVTGAEVTPTPSPTPAPTPAPTVMPSPTPTATPLLPLPSLPLPSASLPAVLPSQSPPPSGSGPTPRITEPSSAPHSTPDVPPPVNQEPPPTPGASPSGAAPLPGGSEAPDAGPGGSPSGSSGGPGSSAVVPGGPTIAFDERRLDLGTVGIGVIGGLEVWTVPVATLGVPGILLLVWVALQSIGALAWIPAVRSLRDTEDAPT